MSITTCVGRMPRTSLGIRINHKGIGQNYSSSKALKKVGGGSTRGGASAVAAAGAAKTMSASTYKVLK